MPKYETKSIADKRQLALSAIEDSAAAFRAELPELDEPLRKLLARLEGAPLPCIGVVHLACPKCETRERLAFRCGPRCPLCGGKGAPKQLERLMPDVPVRHWSLSLPASLRPRLALDHPLARKVGRALMHAIFAWLKRSARRELGLIRTECGAINVTQRFGGALEANLHFHALVIDGVYTRCPEGGPPVFHILCPPTASERAWVLDRARERIEQLLRDHPLPSALAQELKALEGRASKAQVVDRAVEIAAPSRPAPHAVRRFGFSLAAEERVEASDRAGLRRLCHYLTRAPLDPRRVDADPQGLRLRLKRALDDGTAAINFTDAQLARQLLELMPASEPTHAVSYHGVLAPNAALRWKLRPAPTQLPLALPALPRGMGPEPSRIRDQATPSRVAHADSTRARGPSETPSLRCRSCAGQMLIVAVEDATDMPTLAPA